MYLATVQSTGLSRSDHMESWPDEAVCAYSRGHSEENTHVPLKLCKNRCDLTASFEIFSGHPLQCRLIVSKLAGNVLLIEATQAKMMWRVINSGKSACLLLTLHCTFFDHYVLYSVSVLNTSVLLKVRFALCLPTDLTICIACVVALIACLPLYHDSV
jgi:hypothetical protein